MLEIAVQQSSSTSSNGAPSLHLLILTSKATMSPNSRNMLPLDPSKQQLRVGVAPKASRVTTSVPKLAPSEPGLWQAPTATTVATTKRTRPPLPLASRMTLALEADLPPSRGKSAATCEVEIRGVFVAIIQDELATYFCQCMCS